MANPNQPGGTLPFADVDRPMETQSQSFLHQPTQVLLGPSVPYLQPLTTMLEPFRFVIDYRAYRLMNQREQPYADELGRMHKLTRKVNALFPNLAKFDGTKPMKLLSLLHSLVKAFNSLGICEAVAVRLLAFYLTGEASRFFDQQTSPGYLYSGTPRIFSWPNVIDALLKRYMSDHVLHEAYQQVTSISQAENEDESAYAARLSAAAQNCNHVFNERTLVHHYITGLLPTTRDIVTERVRGLPIHEQSDLSAVRRVALAEVSTYRARHKSYSQTKSKNRHSTMYMGEPSMMSYQPVRPEIDDGNESAVHSLTVATSLDEFLFIPDQGQNTSSSTTDSEIDQLMNMPKESIPKLTEEQRKLAYQVIPENTWHYECLGCREKNHSLFQCRHLDEDQRIYFAYKYYLHKLQAQPHLKKFYDSAEFVNLVEEDGKTSLKPEEGEEPKTPDPDSWREKVDLSHLEDEDLRERVYSVLAKYKDMWRPGKLGCIKATEHRIELVKGTKPIHQMPYRQGLPAREKTIEIIQQMMEQDVIEPCTSEWASPVVFAPKKDGSTRFCVDYRRLNAVTKPDVYPLPRMDDCLDSLGDAMIFTTLDANSGYWQLPVAEEDRDKTTFTTFAGTFRYKRMPFGLRNAPATFQRALDIILSGVRWQTCLIYLDDVIIFSKDIESHLKDVDEVLRLLHQAGVTLKLKKCSWFTKKVHYLGHDITPGKLAVAKAPTDSFAKATFPTNITQLRSFLGAANVYRRFIRNYAHVSKPLTAMLCKDADVDWSSPTDKQLEAFEHLKSRLTTPPILSLPKKGRPFMIDTDASKYQLGAALLQQQDEEDPKDWKLIGFYSKTLNETEQRYSTTELECYAVVWSVLYLRPYIEGTHFKVRTDHEALKWLMTLTDPSGRLTRWRLRLAEFDYEITYRPGRVHQVPDALSRIETSGVDKSPVDDEIPSFDPTMVVTRSQMAASQSMPPDSEGPTHASISGNQDSGSNHHEEDDEVIDLLVWDGETPEETFDDDLDETADEPSDVFDFNNVFDEDGTQPRIADTPLPVTRAEVIDAQRTDDFCQTVLARQSETKDSKFFEDEGGILRRKNPHYPEYPQIVVPASLRPRILSLAHYHKLAGHPGQSRMYYTMRQRFYWPHMAADIQSTVRNCHACAKNRIRLRKRSNPLKTFPATVPLRHVSIDILGALKKTKQGNRWISGYD